MTAKNPLELIGQIDAHPVAETLLELRQAALTGSLRVERDEQKAIIYLDNGIPVYAVSNQRSHRLSRIFASQGIIDEQFLLSHKHITNDLQLADAVVTDLHIHRDVVTDLARGLCVAIILELLKWHAGQWTFSPNSRLKDGIAFQIDVDGILAGHARSMTPAEAASRLSYPNDTFTLRKLASQLDLDPQEAFIVSRLETGKLTLSELSAIGGSDVSETKRLIYTLWMRGILSRTEWRCAVTEEYLATVGSVHFRRKEVEQEKVAAKPKRAKQQSRPIDLSELVAAEPQHFDLEQTLKRIESAWNHYQVLDLEPSAKPDQIRKSYFGLAKLLHPDRFRRETPELARRVERAFTELALAHETLKTDEGRRNYDMRMRELEMERAVQNADGPVAQHEGRAAVEFERGFSLQLNGDFETAVPYLARAVHYAPANAKYHAYYGKALSIDEDQRHKSQSELLAAVKLEPENASFRLLLAEFYIRYKLVKRAEGELVKLLEIAPHNHEARALLDTVRAKSLN